MWTGLEVDFPQEGRAEPAELAAGSLCLVNLGVSTRLLNCVGKETPIPGGCKARGPGFQRAENYTLFINLTTGIDV
jgi:hypothetical protein